MINLKNEYLAKIDDLWDNENIENTTLSIRNLFKDSEGRFSVFELMKKIDVMTILHDDKEDSLCRFITFKDDYLKNYLVLSASRSIEEMRFDAACMLRKLLKEKSKGKNSLSFNCSVHTKAFSREDKHFACALLMPRKRVLEFITQKDANGNYLYLNENKEISLKNINAVADRFGVPYSKCCSRLFNMFEDLRREGKPSFHVEGCYNRDQYKKTIKSYSEEQRLKDLREVAPNYKDNEIRRMNHLIDSLHYRTYDRLSEVAKRRLLINLAKFDSVNEGVVESEEEAKNIINNFIASGGVIRDGKLITKDGECELSDEQLVVLGEYNLYNKALSRGLIKGIAKSDPRLEHIAKLSYKDAINSLTERDITRYIRSLHERMFVYLQDKYKERRGGLYRESPVRLSGTNVETADPSYIPQIMDNISWKILEVLKKNANGELSNSEYVDKINECIYEMIRMQPFADGNKRTSRLLSNILYQEKGIPFVLLPVSLWNEYVDAWRSDDIKNYNNLMHRLIIESYSYFYGNQTANEAVISKSKSKKIITANVNKK